MHNTLFDELSAVKINNVNIPEECTQNIETETAEIGMQSVHEEIINSSKEQQSCDTFPFLFQWY